ncbi:MAG: hypothetical protein ACK5OB_05730 [Pirellula sp.]|jgi:hypothetical protein
MPFSTDEIRELCTKEELAIVLASQSPALEKLSPAEVKKHASNARKLSDKWQKLSRGQARTESRKSGSPDLDSRSHAKHTLFKEVLGVFESRSAAIENLPTVTSGAGRKTPSAIRTQQARVTRQTTRKELHGTKKKLNAAAKAAAPAKPAAAAASTTTKVATKKKAKPATKTAKKGTTKAAAAKKALNKTAATRAARRPTVSADAKPATSVKPAVKAVAAKKVAPATTTAQKTALAGKAKANRVAISNRTSNIAGHVSGKGKRAQARRDTKSR